MSKNHPLIEPEHTGKGFGRFIVAYLFWQAWAPDPPSAGTTPPRSAPTKPSPILRWLPELPNDYLMIEFPRVRWDRPVLGL